MQKNIIYLYHYLTGKMKKKNAVFYFFYSDIFDGFGNRLAVRSV